MKGLVGCLGWLCVLCLSSVALAQTQPAPPAAESGEVDKPPALPVAAESPAANQDASAANAPSQPSASDAPPPRPAPPAPPVARVQSQVSASGSVALDDEAPPGDDGEDEGEPAAEDEGRGFEPDLELRTQNTLYGPTGGLRLIDASSGPVGTARLQFGLHYFTAGNYLVTDDDDQQLGGVLALSLTPAEHVEAFISLSTHANSNTRGNPVLLQVAGDLNLGVKGFTQLLPWLGVGGDVRLLFLNTIGDLGVILKGTTIGLRGAATADLRRVREPLPILLRANLEYLLDNSSELIEGVEDARYASISPTTRLPLANEDRHLVTRIERFALGINRVDMLNIGVGGEVPLEVSSEFWVHPLLELRVGIPVNRQGYSCLSVATNATLDDPDGCLAVEGLSAAPSTLTLGARVLPPVKGLSALLAFDIGLLGTSTFVRELAPNRPWTFVIAAQYAIDTRPPRPEIQYVRSEQAPPPPAAAKARVHGVVVERGFNTAVLGAVVHYPDLELSPQLTGSDGGFVSYELDPGPVTFEVTHPDYEPARCSAAIPAPAQAPTSRGAPSGSGPPAAGSGSALLEMRCELTARPRSASLRGSVVDAQSAPVSGVSVEVSGPANQTVSTDASGDFVVSGLPVGDYVARVDAPAFLLKSQPFSVTSGTEVNLQLVLIAKPKDASVTLTAKEVKIRNQIMFKSNSAEIDERSTALLSEIADVLLRNPQAARVQVQGHTDNRGDPETNLALSQQRAEAVVQWLTQAGVGADRLEAKGYGDSRPIVPNLTPGNRARNRRVQFIVRE